MNGKVHPLDAVRPQVQCYCGHVIFDGIVVKSRVVRVLPRGGAEALCRCKRWQPIPVTYSPMNASNGQLSASAVG